MTVALGLAELGFRWVMPTSVHHLMYVQSADPLLAIDLRPGADLAFEGVTIRIPPSRIRISRQGLRADREYPVPKPRGVRRLLCLGDSTTFGWGVEVQDTFCRRLQEALPPGWETVNLGIPSFNTTQEVRRLERFGLTFQPDIVVLLFDDNDLEPPHDQGDPDSGMAWLVDHSALVRWIHFRLARSRNEGGDSDAGDARSSWDGVAEAKKALSRLAALGKERGFRTLVVLPDPQRLEAIAAHVKALGFPSAEWRDVLDADPAGLTIPEDRHPNAEGHRRLAARLLAALRSHRLIE